MQSSNTIENLTIQPTLAEPKSKGSKSLFGAFFACVAIACAGSLATAITNIQAPQVANTLSLLILILGATWIAIAIRSVAASLAVATLASAAEFMGMLTGIPFGQYSYTGKWFPSVPAPDHHSFPVAVPFAWILIVGALWLITSAFSTGYKRILAVASFATIIDFGLEDLMVNGLQYWQWNQTGPVFGAPLVNSLGWFLVAGVAAALYEKLAAKTTNPSPNQAKSAAILLGAYFLLMTELAALKQLPSTPLWIGLTTALIGVILLLKRRSA